MFNQKDEAPEEWAEFNRARREVEFKQLHEIFRRLDRLEEVMDLKPAQILFDPKEPVLRLRENLMGILKRRGLKASALARASGVSKQVISDWTAGTMPRDPVKLKRVALSLGVTLDELLFGK